MKKIIGIIFISLMFCNIGFAEIKLIEQNIIRYDSKLGDGPTSISTFCVDGYKFIIAKDKFKAIDLKQMFEERDGKSLPAKC